MKLSFPPITRSDEVFLFALYASTRANEMAVVPWSNDQKHAFLQSQFKAQHQHYTSKYPNAKFLLVCLEGEKIGRLYVNNLDNEIHIIDLTILPEHRGKGFGTKIISDILQDAKNVSIYLESFNQSINLFKRLGFQTISDEGIYQLWEWKDFAAKSLKNSA